MKYFVILLVLTSFAVFVPHVFGAYVEFDYKLFVNNKHIVDFQLNWAFEDYPNGKITFDEPINDTILLQIPKNIPRNTNLDFGSSLYAIQTDGSWEEIKETDSNCFYILEIPVNDSDYVKIETASAATGRWEPVTIENEECDALYDESSHSNKSIFPRHGYHPSHVMSPLKQFKSGVALDEIQCKESLTLVVRHNGSPSCVTESTKQKLIERGWAEKSRDSSNPLQQKWTYNTKGEISSINISEDDSIIVIGTKIRDTQKGMLYVLDESGAFLWKKEFDSMISHVDISNNIILAKGFHICGGGGGARTHCNYTADIFDIQGNAKQSYVHDDKTAFGASLSPNGNQVITHTYDVLKYFNIEENDSWTYNPEESIRQVIFLTDSILLVNTEHTGEIIALDNTGDKLWNFTTNYPNNYSYATSSDGKYFVASDYISPDDGNIYLLDYDGNLLWQANAGNTVLHMEFSGDDSRILAKLNGAFMVYDIQGNLLWKNNIPSDLTISSNGSFLLGTTFNQGSGASITLFDDNGNVLSNNPIIKESLSAVFALANNDEYFAMANDTEQLVLFEVNSDFDEIYYDLTDLHNSDDLHVKIVPKMPGLFDVTIAKGDYVEIPWDVQFDQGYARSNFGVSITSDSDMESWITPTSPYTIINGVPPSEKIITIHPKSNTSTGNYTVKILGKGDVVHNQTGWMTNLDGKTLGMININVILKPLSLEIIVEEIENEN